MQDILLKCCDNPQGMPMLTLPEDSLPAGETAFLYQNTPNPFTSNTEIQCYLPETTMQATLFIYSLQGAQFRFFHNANRITYHNRFRLGTSCRYVPLYLSSR